MTARPILTVITPSYNQGRFLGETIESVLNQRVDGLEFIIVDGGSTDESVDVIKKYENRLAFWSSGKDRGQTDAINKGLSRATGELLTYINSDDILYPGSLMAAARATSARNASLSHPLARDNARPRLRFRAASVR